MGVSNNLRPHPIFPAAYQKAAGKTHLLPPEKAIKVFTPDEKADTGCISIVGGPNLTFL